MGHLFPVPRFRSPLLSAQPAFGGVWDEVEARDVGFDVDQRSAVVDVHARDFQNVSIALDQPDDRRADAVGAAWMPRRIDPMRFVVKEGRPYQLYVPDPVEMTEQINMGKAFDVLEAFLAGHQPAGRRSSLR